MNIFSRYSPAIQRYIYEEGWQKLRAIQAAAGDAIFNSDANVLLSASTASGKTEAAFFPIITLMQEQPPTSIGCLYIAPLKALINDQFVRLNDICRECGVEVWHWHGDVSQEQKKKLMRHPSSDTGYAREAKCVKAAVEGHRSARIAPDWPDLLRHFPTPSTAGSIRRFTAPFTGFPNVFRALSGPYICESLSNPCAKGAKGAACRRTFTRSPRQEIVEIGPRFWL